MKFDSWLQRSTSWGNYEDADLDELFANFGTNREYIDGEEDVEVTWSHDSGLHGYHSEDRHRHTDRHGPRHTDRHGERRRPGARRR